MKITNVSEHEVIMRDGLDNDMVIMPQESLEVPDNAVDRLLAIHSPDLKKTENVMVEKVVKKLGRPKKIKK